jgi:hypothetical protein
MRQALSKALAQASSSPSTAAALVDAVVNNLTVDDQLKSDIFGVANRLRTLGAGGLVAWTLPADGGWEGNQQVLLERAADAQPLLDYFRGTGPAPSPAATTATSPGASRPLIRTIPNLSTPAPTTTAPAAPTACP